VLVAPPDRPVRRCVEVIVSTFIDRRFRRRARRHRSRRDNILLSAHSLVEQVGQVVEAAGVLSSCSIISWRLTPTERDFSGRLELRPNGS
jgi:hypothetical protein